MAPDKLHDIFPDQKAINFIAFPEAAVAYCNSLSVTDIRVIANNGSFYEACTLHDTCKQLSLHHIRSIPFTPKDQWQGWRLHQNYRHRKHLCQSRHFLGPTRSIATNLAQSVN